MGAIKWTIFHDLWKFWDSTSVSIKFSWHAGTPLTCRRPLASFTLRRLSGMPVATHDAPSLCTSAQLGSDTVITNRALSAHAVPQSSILLSPCRPNMSKQEKENDDKCCAFMAQRDATVRLWEQMANHWVYYAITPHLCWRTLYVSVSTYAVITIVLTHRKATVRNPRKLKMESIS